MASTRERVSFPGLLRGQGHEASCTVRATKVTLPGTGHFAYTQYSIENVSKTLPEGEYQLSANGEVSTVRHQNGHWLSASSADFAKFVKSQRSLASAVDQIDWAGERDEWLRYLDELYAQIESFLEAYLSDGPVRCEYRQINLNEENIGSYTANQMVLHIGQQAVTFTPIGTMLIGTKGRVDVLGPAGEARLFLVNKKATSARSLIQVTVSVGGRRAPPVSEPQEPIEWAWKIAPRPPHINFIDLTEATFFEMILAVANA